MKTEKEEAGFLSILPFLIFVVTYLSVAIILFRSGDNMGFYGFKAPIAALIGIIAGFFIHKGSVEEKFNSLVRGCGDENIMIMCLTYLLAGAFSNVTDQMGAIDSTVKLGLTLIAPKYISIGIFIISSFLSIATGTSVGTIVAMGPIVVGLGQGAGLPLALVLASMVGGAMFGDNLSIISDTTIAATRTQNCSMKDKFRLNLYLALPAFFISLILFLVFGKPLNQVARMTYEYDIVRILPYIFVLLAALRGINVFLVLTGGIVFSGILGLYFGEFDLLGLTNIIYQGFENMFEIFLLSMLTGGLANMVKDAGGMDYLLGKLKARIKGQRSAQLGIAAMTSLTNIATANNTIAIITTGPLAKDISKEYRIDPRRTASLLDVFSCVVQGLIPYGAQLLMACKFTDGQVRPIDLFPYSWYQFSLLAMGLISIFFPLGQSYLRKHPWDFKNWKEVGR